MSKADLATMGGFSAFSHEAVLVWPGQSAKTSATQPDSPQKVSGTINGYFVARETPVERTAMTS